MEKRYQVFISSTFTDLVEARKEVMQALLELDCMPAGMELFPAANDDQWTLIKEVIDTCDYYIVVIGGRYGSLGKDGKSYTQMEYEYAVSKEIPVIAFLHAEPESLPSKHTENDSSNRQKLEEFRKITKKRLVRHWESPQELGSVVSRSLVKLMKSAPRIGWVRADKLPDKDSTQEILELRNTVEKLKEEIKSTRMNDSKEIEHLAQEDDKFFLEYSFKAQAKDVFFEYSTYKSSYTVTWNKIFSIVAPCLIDEADDSSFKAELTRFIQEKNEPNLKRVAALKDLELNNFELNEDSYNTIKVQLLALGLIRKSVRNRSVRDKANYWSLTEVGESMMTKLRAIRREGFEDESLSDSDAITDVEELVEESE